MATHWLALPLTDQLVNFRDDLSQTGLTISKHIADDFEDREWRISMPCEPRAHRRARASTEAPKKLNWSARIERIRGGAYCRVSH
jgi:hypothetical protein